MTWPTAQPLCCARSRPRCRRCAVPASSRACRRTHARVVCPQLTSNTCAHMSVQRDAAEHTMQAALEGIAHARTLIAKCREIDAEMAQVDALAAQMKAIKQTLATLEAALGTQ